MQRVQAMDSWVMKFIATHIMPCTGRVRIFDSLCNDPTGGVTLYYLLHPSKRPIKDYGATGIRNSWIVWVVAAWGILLVTLMAPVSFLETITTIVKISGKA